MQVEEIEYNQPPPLTHNTQLYETHSQLQPFRSTAARNSNLKQRVYFSVIDLKTVTQPENPAITCDNSLVIVYICTLDETSTKSSDLDKFDRHFHGFH